jgi:predicted NAD/FAD-binding protein
LFAQRRNLLRPRFWRLLSAIHRFNQEAVPALEHPQWADITVGDYVRQRGYGTDFLQLYLVPMSSAVWSTPPDQMLAFPAVTLLRFFHNHGFLGLHTQHPWWTVDGGAREYVRRLWPLLGTRVRLNRPVRAVSRLSSGGARVITSDGTPETFDRVILATHADQALRLLDPADAEERQLLGEFKYQPNEAVVHTDTSVMPSCRRAWASWNYRVDAGAESQPQTIYWMNSLQGVSERQDYFVSINGVDRIAPSQVLRRIQYEHPLFSLGAIRAQAKLPALNRRSPSQAVYFAGSYFRYGFHEDALGSALDCARAIAGPEIWNP